MSGLFQHANMRTSKSTLQLLLFAVIVILISTFHIYALPYLTMNTAKVGGFEETILEPSARPIRHGDSRTKSPEKAVSSSDDDSRMEFLPGIPKASGSDYSRVMVIPRTKDEDIAWIAEELPGLDLSVYVVDEPTAPQHPPKNKGHEVMVYLSYIIDHYDNLPDIVIFMHAHRWTHHNNELLGADASQMIRRLSNEHVVRSGFVNMRCSWAPGCPRWLYFNGTEELMGKQEETFLSKSWKELFPLEPPPPYLAQPCCAQFAVSSTRILSIPRSRFAYYRDWMMKTTLTDYISGRIMEYSWQYIFTGKGTMCPAEHLCYCDTYGVCFGGSAQYEAFVHLGHKKEDLASDLEKWKEANRFYNEQSISGASNTTMNITAPDQKELEYLQGQIRALEKEQDERKEKALKRGNDPRLRAVECGRPWKEDDGY